VVCAHRHAPRRHGRPVSDALRGVGQKPLQDGGAQAGPDQTLGDMRIGRVELVQVRVRLPLLEEQLSGKELARCTETRPVSSPSP
jgi:hypothetical protein